MEREIIDLTHLIKEVKKILAYDSQVNLALDESDGSDESLP